MKLINALNQFNDDVTKLSDMGIDMIESPVCLNVYDIFNIVLEDHYGSEGLDWVLWFIYEKQLNPELRAYDHNVEIIKDLDGLYEYLEKDNKIS